MSIELQTPELTELKPKITVIGVGGAGGNAVNNMIARELQGVEFVAANTDAQALSHSKAHRKIQLGAEVTQGLGAGSQPDVGRAAAEETMESIEDALSGSHMVFITAGMGGGTGTGAAPVVARHAREKGILTVGVVTKPFHFEGARRMSIADQGIEELQQHVDTLIIIPNQNLFRIANEKTTFQDAFNMADEVLNSGVRGITDLMVMPGLINLDFADVRAVMQSMGRAMMGTGEAEGESRAVEAAEAAISNPLLDETSMKGAQGVIINITGGMDLTLFEVDEAANHIRSEVDPDANIIVGSAFEESLDGRMRVSVVATGVGAEAAKAAPPERPAKNGRMAEARSDKLGLSLVFSDKKEKAETQTAEVSDAVEATETAEKPPREREHEYLMGGDNAASEFENSLKEDVKALSADEEGISGDNNTETDNPEALARQAEAARKDSFLPGETEAPDMDEADDGAPDPFAEAALANGPAVRENEQPSVPRSRTAARRNRGASLFERMTSGFRSPSGSANDGDTPSDEEPAPARPGERTEPSFSAGDDKAEKEKRNRDDNDDDDQLEIPVFLRSQAN